MWIRQFYPSYLHTESHRIIARKNVTSKLQPWCTIPVLQRATRKKIFFLIYAQGFVQLKDLVLPLKCANLEVVEVGTYATVPEE